MELTKRPRRLRNGEYLRKMVRETRMDKSSLMYPMFVMEGEKRKKKFRRCQDSTATVWTVSHISWSSLQKQVSEVLCFSVSRIIRMKQEAAHTIRKESYRESTSRCKREIPGALLCNRCVHV